MSEVGSAWRQSTLQVERLPTWQVSQCLEGCSQSTGRPHWWAPAASCGAKVWRRRSRILWFWWWWSWGFWCLLNTNFCECVLTRMRNSHKVAPAEKQISFDLRWFQRISPNSLGLCDACMLYSRMLEKKIKVLSCSLCIEVHELPSRLPSTWGWDQWVLLVPWCLMFFRIVCFPHFCHFQFTCNVLWTLTYVIVPLINDLVLGVVNDDGTSFRLLPRYKTWCCKCHHRRHFVSSCCCLKRFAPNLCSSAMWLVDIFQTSKYSWWTCVIVIKCWL